MCWGMEEGGEEDRFVLCCYVLWFCTVLFDRGGWSCT